MLFSFLSSISIALVTLKCRLLYALRRGFDVPKVPTRQKRDEIPIDSSNEVGDPINQPISP